MAQSLDELKRRLRDRLDELRPLVDEYQQLERAAEALGAGSPPGSAPESRSPKSRAPRAQAAKRAPRGANKSAVLGVVAERPGVTVGEIAEVTGIAKPLIYNVTRTAIGKGEVEQVDLGGGRKGFKAVDGTTPEPPAPKRPAKGKSLEEGTEGIEDPDTPAPVGG